MTTSVVTLSVVEGSAFYSLLVTLGVFFLVLVVWVCFLLRDWLRSKAFRRSQKARPWEPPKKPWETHKGGP